MLKETTCRPWGIQDGLGSDNLHLGPERRFLPVAISWAFCRNLKQPKKTNKKKQEHRSWESLKRNMIFQFASDLRLKKRCQIVSTLNDLRKRKFGETFLVFLKNLNVVSKPSEKKNANLPLWSQESPWLPAFFPSWRPYWLLQTFGAPGQCIESCWDFNGTDPTLFFLKWLLRIFSL